MTRAMIPVPALLLVLLLSGCFAKRDTDGPPRVVPIDPLSVPDAQPAAEPRSRYGNPPTYEVAGQRYHVLKTATGYRERGHASWYGSKFHGRRTSSGETYDMFAMTAAHKTLPLPSYVRVTHLGNGRSIVVRVNDRGPFHPDRIIDLSYTAAVKLGFLEQGTALVEVEAITPTHRGVARIEPTFLQVGAFQDSTRAASLREEVAAHGLSSVEVRSERRNRALWHRVLVGPFADAHALEEARLLLEGLRLPAAHVLH
jgi:rare lipoprotein A